MPWTESDAVDQRLRFVLRVEQGDLTMAQSCKAFGISRTNGYKWLKRYGEAGLDGLLDRSRAPLKHGRATDEALAAAIVQMKRRRMTWGPRKVLARLMLDRPQEAWPSASVAGEILRKAQLVQPRRRRWQASPTPNGLTTPERPNHVWAVDHKGWVQLGDGGRCEPLTITDSFSRYLLVVSAGSNTREAQARPLFEIAFAEFGLPEVIRSDNGPPFASTGVTGLSALSAWWTSLGIRHERTKPGRPQQNGRHERFHLTLLEAMTPPEADRAAQAERFAAFRQDYNHERPHEALDQLPPARFYQFSPRPMPDKIPEPRYPAQAVLRQVRSNGEIKWGGAMVHISSALAGEAVAVEQTPTGHSRVRFYDRLLGVIDPRTNRLGRLSAPADAANDV
jgi:transposase InsO family protein